MCLMNNIIGKYLDKFGLVFINDIFIYSWNEEEHKEQFKLVLRILRENQLYAKFSKCDLYKTIIQYLGHVISKEGLLVDPKKVKAMVDWTIPKYMYVVCPFMRLAAYYHIFIEAFSIIAYLIKSLQREGTRFEGIVESQKCDDTLRHLLTTTPILKLAYPNK